MMWVWKAETVASFQGTAIARRLAILIFFAVAACANSCASLAQTSTEAEQQRLFEAMARHPTNHQITLAFAKVATDRGDYEAAIGALERLLFYNPNLAHVKYELGALYYRLRSFEMARRYFREAWASPDLDAVTRVRIESYLPDTHKQLQASRFSGFAQTGLRYQSNANFAPTVGLVRLGGQDLGLTGAARKTSDTNWFGLVGLAHDFHLDNQRGDVFETRFAGYATDQFRLDELNVGLFDVSFGPRLALAPEHFPGATFKPYIVGGKTWVGGSSYSSSVGAGLSAGFPMTSRFTIGPEFEWRRLQVDMAEQIPTSRYNSGDWYTVGLTSTATITQQLRLDARGYFRHGNAAVAFQEFDQWGGEAALIYEFAPPSVWISRNWTISPFARYVRTEFQAADPFIDATIPRKDSTWTAGMVFNAAITTAWGVSATVQYEHTSSTLPNYRQNNLSVVVGPTARF